MSLVVLVLFLVCPRTQGQFDRRRGIAIVKHVAIEKGAVLIPNLAQWKAIKPRLISLCLLPWSCNELRNMFDVLHNIRYVFFFLPYMYTIYVLPPHCAAVNVTLFEKKILHLLGFAKCKRHRILIFPLRKKSQRLHVHSVEATGR